MEDTLPRFEFVTTPDHNLDGRRDNAGGTSGYYENNAAEISSGPLVRKMY